MAVIMGKKDVSEKIPISLEKEGNAQKISKMSY